MTACQESLLGYSDTLRAGPPGQEHASHQRRFDDSIIAQREKAPQVIVLRATSPFGITLVQQFTATLVCVVALMGHSWSKSAYGRRRARRLERIRQADQQLAWRVQDVLVGCGLSQVDYSIGGGRIFRIPQVISVIAGPPVGLNIRILPGQSPDDFVAHTRRIAYNLDVAEVRVVPLGPYLIRLELLPKPVRSGVGHWINIADPVTSLPSPVVSPPTEKLPKYTRCREG